MTARHLPACADADEPCQGAGQLIEAAGIGQRQLQLRAALFVVLDQRLQPAAHFAQDRVARAPPRRSE